MDKDTRRRLERSYTKCACGNTARKGKETCGRCDLLEDMKKHQLYDWISTATSDELIVILNKIVNELSERDVLLVNDGTELTTTIVKPN